MMTPRWRSGNQMTLLERWDRTDHKETVNRDEIRRAIAIAQAVEEFDNGELPALEDPFIVFVLKERADELLAGKK